MAIVELDRSPPHHSREASRLFEAHADWLRGYCLRRLGSPADADDAVQTTFLHALRALARGVEPACEEAWLTTIAKNACRTQRRTAARRGALATDVDLDAFEGRHIEDDDRELLIDFDDALASLPDTQREALVLRELRGVPSQEIASRLSLSTPATHALLTRARRSLARALTVPRSAAGLDFGWLLAKLLAPLRLAGSNGAAKIAAVGAVAAVATGGVAIERGTSSPNVDRSPRAESTARTSQPAAPASTAHALAARTVRAERGHRLTATGWTRSTGAAAPLPEHSLPPTPVDEAPSGPTEAPVPPGDDESGPQEQETPAELPPPTLELPPLPVDPAEELPLPPLPPVPVPPLPELPVETPSLPVLPPAEPALPLP